MPFKKGAKPGPGRPEGSPNKIDRDIKQVISEMVTRIGQPEEMDKIMREAKSDTKLNFLAKVAPKDMKITGENGEPFKFTINILDNGRERNDGK